MAVKSTRRYRYHAELGRLSWSTISHVLNDTPRTRVAEGTRVRVREAAEALGFRPRPVRRRRSARTRCRAHGPAQGGDHDHAARGPDHSSAPRMRRESTTWTWSSSTRTREAVPRLAQGRRPRRSSTGRSSAASIRHDVPPGVCCRRTYKDMPTVLINSTDRAGIVPAAVPDEVGGTITTGSRVYVEDRHTRIGFLNNDDDVPATHHRLLRLSRACSRSTRFL